MMRSLMFCLLFCITICGCTQSTVVPFGSSFKYLDDGTDQGTAWRAAEFNDASWKTGSAEFGYGEGDEKTVVSYGSNSKKKQLTTYFRKKINLDPALYGSFTLGLKRDDGAIVYVNNKEVYRSNMPTGVPTYKTEASTSCADDGRQIQSATLPSSAFVKGDNIIAVELHQSSPTDKDISFDLRLEAAASAPPATGNTPPVAKAGNDQSVNAGTASLNGSASYDKDGRIVKYAWTQSSGPADATINEPAAAVTSISVPEPGNYVFKLKVTDDKNATNTDYVSMAVVGTGKALSLIRGPYLQMASGTAITIRWRTDVAADSKVRVGSGFENYQITAYNARVATEHEVRITGLTPGTKYFYTIGSNSFTFPASASDYFKTAPDAADTNVLRFAAFGDCGRDENGFRSGSLAAYQKYTANKPADLMLLLGDNAYPSGTDEEYTNNFFNVYGKNLLRNHVVFSTPGNHDYSGNSAREVSNEMAYYNSFSLPKAAECGGVPSGTEAYYSFNWGNVHFISLDSYGYENGSLRLYDTLGTQATWVKKDLAANNQKWTIVFFHHPPYTMGSHNSDTESELVKMRQRFILILERFGVDMVLCGHSHDYERSYLLKGYTGNEGSFNVAKNAVTSSSGKNDGSSNSCPYNLAPGKVNHGTVYVVSGSSGADGVVQPGYPHNAMPFSVDDGGMFYFEVAQNQLDAKFLRRDGAIADKFSIIKGAGKDSILSVVAGKSVTLTASWKGQYKWSNGATTQSITVKPAATTSYTCTDAGNCLTDKFTVNVTKATSLRTGQHATAELFTELKVYPVPVQKGAVLHITGGNLPVQTTLYNEQGQVIKQVRVQNHTLMQTTGLIPGTYYLRHRTKTATITKKVVVVD